MANLEFKDIPEELRRQIMEDPKYSQKTRQRVTAWKDVPESWTQHRLCGWAGFGGPCIYCTDERGSSDVQGARAVD